MADHEHQLLLAEKTLDRLSGDFSKLDGVSFITLNDKGELKRDGKPVSKENLDLTIARLDIDLLQSHRATAVGLLTATEHFRFIQTVAAGLDNPLFPPLVAKTDVFCNSDAQAPAIAEFVVASVLNRWHPFERRNQYQQAHEWKLAEFRQVLGSHWLIVGYGNIGQRVAEQAKGFGAIVTGIRRNLAPHPYADHLSTMDDLYRWLPESDVVVLSCALNDSTKDLANTEFFNAMKSDAMLVNIGRGELLDEAALITALDDGQLDYAALDVFRTEPLPADSPLWEHKQIQVTPHASYAGSMTAARFDELFMSNLKKFLAGDDVINQVTNDFFE